MSPTLLELAVGIVLIIVAWQLGLAIAPSVMHWIRSLKQGVDAAAEEALPAADDTSNNHAQKEHSNGTGH